MARTAPHRCTKYHGLGRPVLRHLRFSWITCFNTSCVERKDRYLALQPEEDEITIHDNDDGPTFVTLLRACAKKKDLERGTILHDLILRKGLLELCSDALVTMYAKCGAFAKAEELLGMHKSRDVVSWTALIAGYTHKGQGEDALNCFKWMRHEGLSPDKVTFACVLKACGSVKAADIGEEIHEEIIRQGLLGNDVVLGTALVNMYSKCGAVRKAQRVLEELPVRNGFSWSALIAGYVQEGQCGQALKCFRRMQDEGISPDAVTFASILKACGSTGSAKDGEDIHDEIARQGLLGGNLILGLALVDMYAKCGALMKAQQALEQLPIRNVIAWNALITGYAQDCKCEQAFMCLDQMHHEGVSPDAVTFSSILKACGSTGAADKGEQIHDEISRLGLLESDIVLGNALVDMYAKCGVLAKAQWVLEKLPVRTVVTWNALITGYAEEGQCENAVNCLEWMRCEGLSPDEASFLCILKACGSVGSAEKGEQMHDMIAKQGLLGTAGIVLGNAVVDMYAKCGALAKAQRMLEQLLALDLVSCSSLLSACSKWGDANVGRWAFECAVKVDRSDAAPYVLMATICAAAGMQEDAGNVEPKKLKMKHRRN